MRFSAAQPINRVGPHTHDTAVGGDGGAAGIEALQASGGSPRLEEKSPRERRGNRWEWTPWGYSRGGREEV